MLSYLFLVSSAFEKDEGSVRCDGDVTTVKDCSPTVERIRLQWNIISTAESEPT